jgi:hypothetical protein
LQQNGKACRHGENIFFSDISRSGSWHHVIFSSLAEILKESGFIQVPER